MPVSLKDQVVLVVGASSGIGRETAVLFAKEGARVMASARREDRLRSLKGALRARSTDFDLCSGRIEAGSDAASRGVRRSEPWTNRCTCVCHGDKHAAAFHEESDSRDLGHDVGREPERGVLHHSRCSSGYARCRFRSPDLCFLHFGIGARCFRCCLSSFEARSAWALRMRFVWKKKSTVSARALFVRDLWIPRSSTSVL